MESIYCPYTDQLLGADGTSPEHIIPLSLGGCDQFTIPVCKKFNAEAGSAIDGALANEFMISLRRVEFDARGHSGKPPSAKVKTARMGEESKPIQISFDNTGMTAFDVRERKVVDISEINQQHITMSFMLPEHTRIRFAAKVALTAGYFIYGDWFRKNVAHNELRAVMNFDPDKDKKEDFKGFGIRAYDEFSEVAEADAAQMAADKYACQMVSGSCVFVIPGASCILMVIGVLGRYVATLNVTADTEEYPRNDDHDLGHAVLIEKGRMTRMSYRTLMQRAWDALERDAKGRN